MPKVAIVVPCYKSNMTENEKISCTQLFKVLGHYDIFFAIPKSLEMSLGRYKVSYVRFSDEYFLSTAAYSRLMLSVEFYRAFEEYEYILIYQLDALVFEDRLIEFCDRGIDYIGAPWISGYTDYLRIGKRVLHVGNGGLSLRNVQHCIEVIQKKKGLLSIFDGVNEDVFFSSCNDETFKVAPFKMALDFSFEREVRRSYQLNGNRLPFGCHAWERYDKEFWVKVLENVGYNLPFTDSGNGNEDEKLVQEYLWLERNSLIFENIEMMSDLIKNLKRILQDSKVEGFYLWGAGYFGRCIQKLLYDLDFSTVGFIDNNPSLYGTFIQGVPVYSIDNVISIAPIIVSTTEQYYLQIEMELKQKKCIRGKDYYLWIDLLPEVQNV